jgi:hypothetical protein
VYSNPNRPAEASPLGLENTATGHLSHSKKTEHRRSLRRRHREPALPSTAGVQPFPAAAVADSRREPIVSS